MSKKIKIKERKRESSVVGAVSLAHVERDYILHVLKKFGGVRAHTALALEITKATLLNKIKLYRSQGYDIPEVSKRPTLEQMQNYVITPPDGRLAVKTKKRRRFK